MNPLTSAIANKDCLSHIFSFLDPQRELPSARSVCKVWHQASENLVVLSWDKLQRQLGEFERWTYFGGKYKSVESALSEQQERMDIIFRLINLSFFPRFLREYQGELALRGEELRQQPRFSDHKWEERESQPQAPQQTLNYLIEDMAALLRYDMQCSLKAWRLRPSLRRTALKVLSVPGVIIGGALTLISLPGGLVALTGGKRSRRQLLGLPTMVFGALTVGSAKMLSLRNLRLAAPHHELHKLLDQFESDLNE